MIKENQFFETRVCRNNLKQYYEERGYTVHKLGEYITVKAEDLPDSSHQKIKYICDYCGKEFERQIYSNNRSKKENSKDACVECGRTVRCKETNTIKYGVSNPMKVPEIQIKCQNSCKENWGSLHSCSDFANGVPVSKAQLSIAQLFPDFELNYHYEQYYIDLCCKDIAIEYDGKGHDLQVRMNKMPLEDFLAKEKIKTQKILNKFRLLRIIDKHDRLRNENKISDFKIQEQIQSFIESDELYKEIIID